MALRFFLNHNLSPETTNLFRSLGFDATDTREHGLEMVSDLEIAAYAALESRIVVTFDTDFGDIRDFPPGRYPGVIRLKLPVQTLEVLHPILLEFFGKVAEADLVGALVTLEPGFYRVRRMARE